MQQQQSFSLYSTMYACQVGQSAVWKTYCRLVSSRGSSNQVTAATLRRLLGCVYKKSSHLLKPQHSLCLTHSVVSHLSCLCQAMAACYRLLLLLSGKMAGRKKNTELDEADISFFETMECESRYWNTLSFNKNEHVLWYVS